MGKICNSLAWQENPWLKLFPWMKAASYQSMLASLQNKDAWETRPCRSLMLLPLAVQTWPDHVCQTRKKSSLSTDKMNKLLMSHMIRRWILLSKEGSQSLFPHPESINNEINTNYSLLNFFHTDVWGYCDHGNLVHKPITWLV